MKILTVVSHPRVQSLTFSVADRFTQGLVDAGHEMEVLDLHRSGFNPVLWEADEPDSSTDRKIYSPEVETEIERMKQHDALAYIFPIWWHSFPAILKGYIDRVWNNGFAYGSNKLHHKKVLWIGLASAPKEHYEKYQYDKMMTHHLNIGIADYCGISNSKVEILYDTLDSRPETFEKLLTQAYHLGLYYDNDLKSVAQ
ncbi:NAD(P)H oxidoreductase [Paenibacillus arenilitoris]|uniref:NAD(P)H oxidoreductase n=1 Tax=Paenibacillus arenilitoris TaxID=2772299 RepID=A0A927CL91_9BACL|nr:NAD(P)H oxidoreductase [Paenibacillus arenilitoris]MBD2868867.1 NAD(P)H oxidoreductase [Paenibacillus arenilitoris]